MKTCNHHYVLKSTRKQRGDRDYNEDWVRIDIYYCDKCLDEKIVRRQASSIEYPTAPDWW